MTSIESASQIAGIAGAITLLYAYAMISKGRFTNTSAAYHICNLAGAFLVGLNTLFMGAVGALILNIAWMAIAAWHLRRVWRKAG